MGIANNDESMNYSYSSLRICQICGCEFTLGVNGILSAVVYPGITVCDTCGGVKRANGVSGMVIEHNSDKIFKAWKAKEAAEKNQAA